MRIDRREFIARVTLVLVAPAIPLLPSQQPASAASQSRFGFMVRGWTVQHDRTGANPAAWITVNNFMARGVAMMSHRS
jgi:hypothetical protein